MSNNNNSNQKMTHQLKSIILIDLELTNTSPLIIGSGKNDLLDVELMRYPDGSPYIPASSYFGILKHYFFDKYNLVNCTDSHILKNLTYWFGDFKGYFDSNDNIAKSISKESIEYQSHIIPKDIVAKKDSFTISIRDGIELEENTLLTKQNSKYDFEIIEPGATFSGTLKLKVRSGIDESILMHILKFIKENITTCRYGRNTTTGYGEMNINKFKIKRYDGKDWIENLNGNDIGLDITNDVRYDTSISENNHSYFKAYIDAEIWKSLLIGAGSNADDINAESDKVFIKYSNSKNRENVPLTGRAYRQALIKRMHRIVNSTDTTFNLADLKGIDKNNQPEKQSRLTVKETTFDIKKVSENIHHRIKIDHFTGGTMNNAKFDSTPIWHKQETLQMEICIHDYADEEAALLVQALKDLVSKDLPLGAEKSIGRGRLTGRQLKLEWVDKNMVAKSININIEEDSITIDNMEIAEELETMNSRLFTKVQIV